MDENLTLKRPHKRIKKFKTKSINTKKQKKISSENNCENTFKTAFQDLILAQLNFEFNQK